MMESRREIEARLKISAVDRASAVLDRIGNRLSTVDRRAQALNRVNAALDRRETGLAAANRRTDGMIGGTGRMLLGGLAAGAAIRGVNTAITDFAALERQIARIGITAGASDEQIGAVAGAIFKFAQDAAVPMDEVVTGFDSLIAAGRSWEDSLAFLPSVVRTAQAAGAATLDIAQTADALASSMDIAGGQMQEAFDVLVEGGKLGKFELKDMAQYLPSILPQMKALGYSGLDGLKQTVAMLQTMRMQTGTASEAATNLTNVLGKIYSPEVATKFKKVFKVNLSDELKKSKENGEDLLVAFIRIARDASGGDMEKLASVFADQQLRAGVLSLMQLGDSWSGFKRGVEGASGAVENDLRRVLAGTQADIDRLSNSWGEFTKNLGRAAVRAGVGDAMDEASKILGDYADKGVGAALAGSFDRGRLAAQMEDPAGKAFIESYRSAVGRDPSPSEVGKYVPFGGTDPADEAAVERARQGGRISAYREAYAPMALRGAIEAGRPGARAVTTTAEGVFGGGVGVAGGFSAPIPAADGFRQVPPRRAAVEASALQQLPGASASVESLQKQFDTLDLAGPLKRSLDDAKQQLTLGGTEMERIAADIMQRISAKFAKPLPVIRPTLVAPSGVNVNRGIDTMADDD